MGNIKVDFFNIHTGETIWLNRPAQLRAAIESSDLGINRQSDRGWRIGKEWKQRLLMARQDRELMNSLAVKYNGEVTESQLLVAVFVREVRASRQRAFTQEEGKFEDQYLRSIRDTKEEANEVSKMDVLEDEQETVNIEELDEPTVTITPTTAKSPSKPKPLSALNSTELKQLAEEIGHTFSADATTNAKMREEIRQAIKSKK